MFIVVLRKLNIRSRLVISLVAGIILFSTILLYSSKLFSQFLIEKYLYNYLEVTQDEVGIGVELMLDDINALAIRLEINDNIYNLLNDKNINYEEKKKLLKKLLDESAIDTRSIGEIAIVTDDSQTFNYIFDDNTFQKPDNLFLNTISKNKDLVTWGPVVKDMNNNSYLQFGKKYRNFFTSDKLGTLIIYIKESALFDIYNQKTPYFGYSFIISAEDQIISHGDKSKVGNIILDHTYFDTSKPFEHYSTKFDGQTSIIAISKFNNKLNRLNCNWNFVSIISQNTLFEIMKKIDYYVLAIGFLMSIVAIVLSLKISSGIVGPIRSLKYKLKDFGRNNIIDISLLNKSGDEIWDLEKSYNEMITRISNLIQANSEEKEKQRELELIALQAQINPHFLYNTLDAIGWIAKLKKQKDIETLVLALSKFFRISLHKGDKFITVQEEIELVESFVTIELIRFPEKFDIEFNIDQSILYSKILKITLQPFVENAIKHGLITKNKGHIKINGYKKENDLILQVIDDGVGFDTNKLFSQAEKDKNYSGYGIRNVDERIKLEYGEKYGVKILSSKNQGTMVEIKLKAYTL
ncbi:MAG: sensor histidine kinase [Clostridiaceae bacterium]|nr:sensor histidine kinase [Clostridiaceae bacterium]